MNARGRNLLRVFGNNTYELPPFGRGRFGAIALNQCPQKRLRWILGHQLLVLFGVQFVRIVLLVHECHAHMQLALCSRGDIIAALGRGRAVRRCGGGNRSILARL